MDDRPTATIVGGGPAGLIAAETLAEAGMAVTVFDHSRSVGRKFLLAGRGGLNITHSEPLDRFVQRYDTPDWVGPIVAAFDPDDVRAWCASLDEGTFVGTSGRVFPESFRATPLLRAWLARLADLGVRIQTRHRWVGWTHDGAHLFDPADSAADGTPVIVTSDVTVFALGGASWPRVGSDGQWADAFEAAGIEVVSMRAANAGVCVRWSPMFVERFAGEPLKNVAISVDGGDGRVRGDAVVTSAGLEGGPIYGRSHMVRAMLEQTGRATVCVDLHPDQTESQLVARLEQRRSKDSVTTWLRRSLRLHPVAIGLLRESTRNRLPDATTEIAALVKRVPIPIESLMPIDRAISTAGGVARTELDDHLMLRRRPGTFVAGEMIDWEAPTGGYLLQASFSTGVVAARGALQWVAR